ncbi:hypothetical protein TRICI_003097, partial [Trichomonascus ciferrii]
MVDPTASAKLGRLTKAQLIEALTSLMSQADLDEKELLELADDSTPSAASLLCSIHKGTLRLDDDQAIEYLIQAMPSLYMAYNVSHDYSINGSFQKTFDNCHASVRRILDANYLSKQRENGTPFTKGKNNVKFAGSSQNRRVTAAPQPSDTEPELYLDLGESSFEERDDHFKDQLRRVTAPSSDELDWDEYLQTLSSEQLAKTLSANGYEMTEE